MQPTLSRTLLKQPKDQIPKLFGVGCLSKIVKLKTLNR